MFLSIKELLLPSYEELNKGFDFDKDTSFALYLLAKNTRKRYSINRKISHFKANAIIKNLLQKGILSLEKSKEEKPLLLKNQKVKKDLRHYTIQDKLLFNTQFSRFFFRFLKPNENLIKNQCYDEVIELIKKDFDNYQSFCFEELCREFLEFKLDIKGVSSFWNKDIELDLYYEDVNLCFVGEVKLNRKICKNVFNLLQNKAKSLFIKPDFYVIFSKFGFSQEILKNQERNLLLFDLEDFKELIGV
ncbi:hypothetical protein DMB92_03310 [Campylobacter sp. MIT 99-7217]|uniref:DUF234 domain-containing protein n=1 Tax=Campylobacter sp. MIT 99-7217 TaxID=535091 RepID=UPI00115AAB68|nr:hypothetical protein DMB92_03310 [Campylobacter sp. MIT 99-7217]